MKRLIKDILKLFRDLITNIFCYTKPIYTNNIIIVRTDAIGDYLLFRNFLEELKIFYQNKQITLIGNKVYQDLAINLDKEYFNNSIWLDRIKFSKNIFYRIKFLREIKKYKYEICINPIHSRDSISNALIKHIYAIEKIAPSGDCINLKNNKDNNLYTKLLKSSEDIMFEYYRNLEFFSNLFNKNLKTNLYIDKNKLPNINTLKNKFNLPNNYSVLFIGASDDYRKWNINNFSKVAIYLIKKYNQNIIICGGKEDVKNAKQLKKLINKDLKYSNEKIINLTGKLSLTELGGIVYNGSHLISNETSCAHLGSILYTKIVIVLYNGSHLGRFIPYPKEIRRKYYPVYHPFIANNITKYKELSNQFAYKSTLNINEISHEQVIKIIDKGEKL